MDIPLECLDTFVFDYLYAAVLPAQPAPHRHSLNDGFSNVSLADASPWSYQPASKFLSFRPREVAYMSQLTRDNQYRQLFSLFLITWSVHPPDPAPPIF
jgi:lathosterol oxidase